MFNVLPQLLYIVKCTLLYFRRTAGTPPVCVLDAVVILTELYICMCLFILFYIILTDSGIITFQRAN